MCCFNSLHYNSRMIDHVLVLLSQLRTCPCCLLAGFVMVTGMLSVGCGQAAPPDDTLPLLVTLPVGIDAAETAVPNTPTVALVATVPAPTSTPARRRAGVPRPWSMAGLIRASMRVRRRAVSSGRPRSAPSFAHRRVSVDERRASIACGRCPHSRIDAYSSTSGVLRLR